MKTIIMAGGKGSRISSLFPDIPKPLVPIGGKPVLEWELISLRDQGFKDVVITVSHMAKKIQEFFGDGSSFGVHIKYYVEEEPLGNAGALFKIRNQLQDEPFILLNADSVFDINFNRLVDFHYAHGGLVTLFTHPNNHPYDSGLIIADENGAVQKWLTKEDERPQWYSNCVNAGLHVIDPLVLDIATESGVEGRKAIDVDNIGVEVNGKRVKVDLDRQVLKPLCGSGKMYCYNSPEYVKDMGTPERFEQVCIDFESGKVQKKNLRHKQKAIFLDRDGTINKYMGFLKNIEDFTLIDGVAEAVKQINESENLAIVATNQPVIARGDMTIDELQEVHNKMETLLGYYGAYLDRIYFCPHHPHKGYKNELPELKIECECRKPKPGMLIKAAEELNIDLRESWMVGDGENDIQAGKAAGCKTALIGEGSFGQDMTVSSLLEFTSKVLKEK